ncbi:hypothetical protein MANY_18370 [Mycolicibacterium anyangense]|uniref:Glycerate kinase n=1 Tax=Mycolicibacterium anyangense TaxID=1431246 RepID=A0A6N4W3J9_9MYCO|nr:glycerate kinase [Mycolicibacterium anyangense]BBZ76500.1 hypothetical protein MANY_18370 [Mycolicibacterium anyangense]
MTGFPGVLRVLVAPDCYGDSLTAVQAVDAIAAGWLRARPGDQVVRAPQSDGGPGFVGVLAERLGGVRHARVSGPLADEVDAEWVYDAATGTAYIECAQACGLALLGGPPTAQTALAAHSRGVGQLVEAAVLAGASTIVVGLGGSGCTDGGRGLIDALGGPAAARERFDGIRLVAATDVEHPLLGPLGAARIFGPQKGADPPTVEILEQRLTDWAVHLDALAGCPVSSQPGAGAAGGLGAALLALGGRRESGAAVIAEHTGLAADIAAADVIVTGEGRFDDQSLHGKVVSALAAGARPRGIPVLVLAGQVTLDPAVLRDAGITAAHSIADHAGSVQRAMDDAAAQLAGLAERTAAQLGSV